MNKTTDYILTQQPISAFETICINIRKAEERYYTAPQLTSTNTENCLSTHMSYEFMLLQTANCTVGYKSLVPASIHRGYLPLQYRHLS